MALTLSICSQDAQNTSYLVNGTLLGMLSSASQRTHVQTTHRTLQLMVAVKCANQTGSTTMIKQQQLVAVWQEFLKIISRRRGNDLNAVLLQYHLNPEWLILLDDRRLQAWLPETMGFYLLRDGEMRRMRPTTPRDHEVNICNVQSTMLKYYAMTLNQHDQLFLLPPALFSYFSAAEAAAVLMDMRQQPAKVGDLLYTARMRGYADEITWFAMEVLHREEDHHPDSGEKPTLKERLPWLFGKAPQSEADESESESMEPGEQNENEMIEAEPNIVASKAMAQKRLLYFGGMGLLAIVLIILIIAAVLSNSKAAGTASTTTSASTTFPTETADQQNPEATPKPDLPVLQVIASQLNLREAASRESKLLDTLVTGDKLYQLAEADGEWVQVLTMDGIEGFVYNIYVKAATSAD